MNSKIFSLEQQNLYESLRKGNKKNNMGRLKGSASTKARSLMNIHNNEAGRRVIKQLASFNINPFTIAFY